MELKSLLSLVLLGLALLFIGIGVLKNRKNHWIYAVTRVAVVILAIVLSVLISKGIGNALASMIWSSLVSPLFTGDAAFIQFTKQAVHGFHLFIFAILFYINNRISSATVFCEE